MNAVAHIYDGGEPRAGDGPGRRNTLLGFAIHTAASVWWALFFEALPPRGAPQALGQSTALSALAYLVDYHVVPRRLRPGFEAALDRRGMLAVYAALAAGFFLSAAARRAPPRYLA